MRATLIEWDGTNLPEELRQLPAGHYVLSPVGDIDDDNLTEEEEAGIRLALDQVESGHIVSYEEAMHELRSRAPAPDAIVTDDSYPHSATVK